MAPVAQGSVLGQVHVTLQGEPIVSADLIALKDVEDGNLWQQIKDSALLWLE